MQTSTKAKRWAEVCGGSVLQTHQSGSQALHGHGPEARSSGIGWEEIIGKIVSFTADPSTVVGCAPTAEHVRYAGSILRVDPLPDYRGLPTCSALVAGRSGKKLTINYTEHYAQVHDTWAEAEKYNGNQDS